MAHRVIARFDDQTIRATLHRGRNLIGSDATCDICLPNRTVSRRHAVVSITDEGIELQDLGSTNGSMVRSQRVERADLQSGDIFMIGRVVVLLEDVHEDDLEVGIVVPKDAFDPFAEDTTETTEGTEAFGPLDHFALHHLPRLLEQLCGDVDRQRLAQQLGFALFETMPLTAIEIIDTGPNDNGMLYAADRPDDGSGEGSWVEVAMPVCQIRARFIRESSGEHFKPVIESGLMLLQLADRRLRGTRQAARLPAVKTKAERPQPPTVDSSVQKIYDQAERVARGDVGIMIYGESGTGKEVLANFVHNASPRASQPLVAINCASLPRDLLEAELFGVERGVATGVEARPGKFETADRGTIFLDEIGDMAAETQAKILRVLQEREVFRIGGATPHPARARIIAATNRPLRRMLAEGTFRSDLYHRIATWEVELPPLRRRRADIPNLAAYFLTREAKRYGIRVRGISRAALRLLRRYRWAGNTRQLKNEIARAVLFLEDQELLDTSRLSPSIRGTSSSEGDGSLQQILEGVERDEIAAALEACGWDTVAASEILRISRPTLYRRIKNLNIEQPKPPKD